MPKKQYASADKLVPPQETASPGYELAPIQLLAPNPNNPRKKFDQEALDKLTESVRQVGILEPILCVKDYDPCLVPYGLRIVAGERRYRAALAAGLQEVPVIIRELTEEQEFEVMLTENLQRADLDPIEEAQAFRAAIDRGYKQQDLAERLGISQAQVANRLRLLKLPAEVQENISREILSAGHGLALVKIAAASPELAMRLAIEMKKNEIPASQAIDRVNEEIASMGKPLFTGGWNEPVFDHQTICIKSKCPSRVHGKPRWGDNKEHPYCIKPECWDMHQEEARQYLRAQKIEEMRAQAKAAGEDPGRDMPYDTYKTFSSYSEFKLEDCQPCEKIGDALDRSFEDTKLKKIRAVMETGVTRDELLFIAASSLRNPVFYGDWSNHGVRKEICKTFDLPDMAVFINTNVPELLAKLRTMDDLALGKLIFACNFRGIAEDDDIYTLTLGAAAGDREEAEAVG